MNLDKTEDMKLARNVELSEENGSRPDTPITKDNSQETCEIQLILEIVIRKYSNITRDLSILIKNLETDTAFSLDNPVYIELCERYIQYNNYRTEIEGKLKSLSPCTKLICQIHFPQIKPNSNKRKDIDQDNEGFITPSNKKNY
ncbi:hypothetical protein NPIL_105511 [Nephila pilipes]|uniref:Uncharacterized protein n=1 Tax=Nephila pilipes TaxID=299642 RepID=A0A8X6N7B0_NEPPI|nr:hypothetical protein NPIL_105511 [Nephila pilipes]